MRSHSPDPLTAASSFEDRRRAQTMNEQDERVFLEGLHFKRQTKLHKIEEEAADRESFNSATGLSAAAEYNQRRITKKREERKSQVEINLGGIDFTDNSPEARKSELGPMEVNIEEYHQS